MRQDLFEEIGKLPIREENCSEEEINRIYNLVLERKRSEKEYLEMQHSDTKCPDTQRPDTKCSEKKRPDTQRRNKKRITLSMVSFAAAAAIVCICIGVAGHTDKKPDTESRAARKTTDAPVTIEPNDRIVVSMYAATDDDQILTADDAKESTLKKISAGEKLKIGTYNPFSSSVPGYPLAVSDGSPERSGKDIIIKIETDEGSLLSWDSETGIVSNKGKNVSCGLGERIYWSPSDHNTLTKEANLKMAMYEENKLIGESVLHIYEEEAIYIAEKIQ